VVACLFLICAPAFETCEHGLVGYKRSLGGVAKTGVVDGPFSKLVDIGHATNKRGDILLVAQHGSGLQRRLELRDFVRKEHIAMLSQWPTIIFSATRPFFSLSAISLQGLVHFFCGSYKATQRNSVQGRGVAEIFNGKIDIPMLGVFSHSWDPLNSNPGSINSNEGIFRYPCTLFGSIGGFLSSLQIGVEVEKPQDAHHSSNSGDRIENLGKSKLLLSIALLSGILIAIVGAWLNSNGIDRWGSVPAMIGWLLIVTGGLIVLYLFMPMASQFLKV